jgi:hypothetical protein
VLHDYARGLNTHLFDAKHKDFPIDTLNNRAKKKFYTEDRKDTVAALLDRNQNVHVAANTKVRDPEYNKNSQSFKIQPNNNGLSQSDVMRIFDTHRKV